MGMQMVIEGDEAFRLATRLAELTGESLSAAVTEALRDSVARHDSDRMQGRTDRVGRVMAIAAEMRAEILKRGGSLDDLATDRLYDEATGLPV